MAGAITVCYSISGREDAPAVFQKTHDLRVLQEGGLGKVSGEIVTEEKNRKVIRCGPDAEDSWGPRQPLFILDSSIIEIEMEGPHEPFGQSAGNLFSKNNEE